MRRTPMNCLILPFGLAILAGGCASQRGLPRSDVAVEVLSSEKIQLRRPEVLITPDGLRVHGCTSPCPDVFRPLGSWAAACNATYYERP